MVSKRSPLADVMLGSNPDPSFRDGWALKTGRTYDISAGGRIDPDFDFSVACNSDRIEAGTIGWIHRSNGADGHLAAVMVISGEFRDITEVNTITGKSATVRYGLGSLRRLSDGEQIPGSQIMADSRWSGRAPYSRQWQRFQNGMSLSDGDADVLRDMLPAKALRWLDGEVTRFRGQ